MATLIFTAAVMQSGATRLCSKQPRNGLPWRGLLGQVQWMGIDHPWKKPRSSPPALPSETLFISLPSPFRLPLLLTPPLQQPPARAIQAKPGPYPACTWLPALPVPLTAGLPSAKPPTGCCPPMLKRWRTLPCPQTSGPCCPRAAHGWLSHPSHPPRMLCLFRAGTDGI